MHKKICRYGGLYAIPAFCVEKVGVQMLNLSGFIDKGTDLLTAEYVLRKSRNKAKLIPVRKMVTRNGKTYETTVYESPEEAYSVDNNGKNDIIDKSERQRIIAEAMKKAKTEPPNYFDLTGRDPSFPQRWKATRFSHKNTLDDHVTRHMIGVGAKNNQEYTAKAIEFIHAPLGEYGDVFVTKKGKIYKYDYKTKILAVAYPDGIIGTYWNLGADKGVKGADKYWENQKRMYKEN